MKLQTAVRRDPGRQDEAPVPDNPPRLHKQHGGPGSGPAFTKGTARHALGNPDGMKDRFTPAAGMKQGPNGKRHGRPCPIFLTG